MSIRMALLIALIAAAAQADFRELTQILPDPSLEARLRAAAETSLQQFPGLKAEDLAISAVDLTNSSLPARADYHGDTPFYPASVIKIFFMADIYALRKESLGDVQRALKEMIVQSDNDATAYLVDIEADTCPGTELQGRALRRFIDRRREINGRFARLGYDISAMMKPWSFGPYGRELQLLGQDRENRNRLTANTTAALMLWIARGRAVSPAASEAMMALLQRPLDPQREDENQVKEFIGEALPEGSKLWSKAGWTSSVRHDAAYIELPGGRKIVLVILTRNLAKELTLIPAITRNVLAELP
jgi:beta-lactamase class A